MIANSIPQWAAEVFDDKGKFKPEWYLFFKRLLKELPDSEEANVQGIVAAAREAALAEVMPLLESQGAQLAALQAQVADSPEIPDSSMPRPEKREVIIKLSTDRASYPASSFEGAEFIEDDTYKRYESNNGSWVEIIYPAFIAMLGADATFPAWKRSGTLIQARLGNDSNYTDVEAAGRAYDSSTWNGSNRLTTEDSIRDKIAALFPTDPPSGVWTPTLTNVANLAASTAYQCVYSRVGNMVTFAGKVDIDPTLAATSTQLRISLPVASNFGAAEDAGGVAFASGIAGQGAAIYADVANDALLMQWVSGDITNQSMFFSGSYRVI